MSIQLYPLTFYPIYKEKSGVAGNSKNSSIVSCLLA